MKESRGRLASVSATYGGNSEPGRIMGSTLDFGSAFGALTDTDYWVTAAMAFVGFLIPTIVANCSKPDLARTSPTGSTAS